MTNLTVYETSGELADPAYLQALVADLAAYEKATGTDPASLNFHSWGDLMEEAIGRGEYDPHFDFEPPACYEEKHGA